MDMGEWRVGSHMAADKERGKADRAKGSEMRGGREGGREEGKRGLTLEGQYTPPPFFCQVEKQQ